MNNLIKPNENEAKGNIMMITITMKCHTNHPIFLLAVDARQEFDLKVGVAFTRFQTRFFQGKYGDLDSTVISYGPCQSPTLAFCVERHDRIQSFQPEPFWTISPTVIQADLPIKLTWMRERLFDKQVTSVFMTAVEEAQKQGAKVLDVSVTKKSKPRPHALNTVSRRRTRKAVSI
jgi:DNA topoisomerase-3